MAIQVSTTTFSQEVRTLAKGEKSGEPMGSKVSDLAHTRNEAKKNFNAAILESTVSLTAADSPQALVLKTALEGINEALSASLGDNSIQAAYDSGIDVSAEATADRIFSLSTAFFSQYQEAHPEFGDDTEAARAAFIDIIRGGVETGFGEARDILQGLSVLDGEVASNIDKTHELVQAKLDEFASIADETQTDEPKQTVET